MPVVGEEWQNEACGDDESSVREVRKASRGVVPVSLKWAMQLLADSTR